MYLSKASEGYLACPTDIIRKFCNKAIGTTPNHSTITLKGGLYSGYLILWHITKCPAQASFWLRFEENMNLFWGFL